MSVLRFCHREKRGTGGTYCGKITLQTAKRTVGLSAVFFGRRRRLARIQGNALDSRRAANLDP